MKKKPRQIEDPSVRIEKDIYIRFVKMAEENRTTVKGLINNVLESYIDIEKKGMQNVFNSEIRLLKND